MPNSDTDAAAEQVLVETIREAPVWKRVALASALTEATRALMLADLRAQFPEASDEELRDVAAGRCTPGTEFAPRRRKGTNHSAIESCPGRRIFRLTELVRPSILPMG